jgi:hypothetical protein
LSSIGSGTDRQRRGGLTGRARNNGRFRLPLSKDAGESEEAQGDRRGPSSHATAAYSPVSGLYRIVRDDDGLQIDFMYIVHGVSSFQGPRKRAKPIMFGAFPLHVATLADIIKSKKAAGRPRDRAVLELFGEHP